MAISNNKATSFTEYVSAIVDKRIRSVSLSISSGAGFLRSLVTQSQTAATAASNSATAAGTALLGFTSVYLGVQASDPSVGPGDTTLAVGAWYIRSSDGRIRFVSAVTSGVPTWSDGSVLPWPVTPGIFEITGTGENAGVKLYNNTAQKDIRVIQKDDGHFSIMDETDGIELLSVVNYIAYVNGAKIWTTANDGSGSGLDADTMRGSNWTSGQVTSFGQTTVRTPSSGGGIVLLANATSGLASIQVLNNTGSTTWGTMQVTSDGNANWVSSGNLKVNGNVVFTTGNDGAGSGLDADTMHGTAYSAFALISMFTNSLTTRGYLYIPASPNNVIIQWGNDVGGTFSFPIAYPNKCINIYATNSDSQGTQDDNAFAYVVSTSQFYCATKSSAGAGITSYASVWWSIGY